MPATILDDPSASFVGGWVNYPNQGYGNSLHYDAAGSGDLATWTFSGLTPGTYQVAATWTPHPNRATNAPYAVAGGSPVLVNQQLAPSDFTDAGVGWKTLGTVTITANTLAVTLGNASTGYVIADAVRIAPVGGASFTLDLPNHALHYQGDGNNNTVVLANTNGHEVASLTENGVTTTVTADGINNVYVVEGTGNDTITDTGRNLGVDQFFYEQYNLGATAAHVTADWQNGFFGCDKAYISGTGPAVVSFNSTGLAQSSMMTVQCLVGTAGSFSFSQSGENDSRGLTVWAWNEADLSSSSIQVNPNGYGSVSVEVVDLGTRNTATITVNIQPGYTGYLSAEVQGSRVGDDSLTLNAFGTGGYGSIDIMTTTTNPNVHHTDNVAVHYYS